MVVQPFVAPKASKGKQNYLPDPFAILSISRTQRKTKFDTVSWDKSKLTSALRDLSTGNDVVPSILPEALDFVMEAFRW